MRRLLLGLCMTAVWACGLNARADVIFDTESVATQTISSPLFGPDPVVITAMGSQHYVLDLLTGVASVTSDFKGTDLPDPLSPGAFLNYDLYNTPASTTGVVVSNGSNQYDIVFMLLFELKITSGVLAGQTFETMQLATFAATDIAGLPFPDGTVLSDPNFADTVVIFAKTSLPGIYDAGDPVGTSFGRTVTITRTVPEPSAVFLLGGGALAVFGFRRLSRKSTSA